MMKDPGLYTKVVMRHLPPTLSEAALVEQVDAHFYGRYNWLAFRPGKTSHRNQLYSRAYIQLKRPEDVIEFADIFNGHVFVNEKGTQFKTNVEYAPSQRVPKLWFKKDGREGTIYKDPEYLEFLEMLSKSTENLPSAEVQLERREAERAGAAKENVIVTPLMEFVRQKRASKGGPPRLASSSRKLGGRARGASIVSPSMVANKRGLERGRYVMRDNTRVANQRDKSMYVLVSQKEQQQRWESELSIEKNRKDALEAKDRKMLSESVVQPNYTELLEDDSGALMKNIQEITGIEFNQNEGIATGVDGAGEVGKKRLLLSKDKEKEFTNGPVTGVSLSSNSMDMGVQLQRRQVASIKGSASLQQPGGALHQHGVPFSGKGSAGTLALKQSQRRESSGRNGRGMLSTKDLQLSVVSSHGEQQSQASPSYLEKDKRPPRPPGVRSALKDCSSGMVSPSSLLDVDVKNLQDEKSIQTTTKDSYGLSTTVERQDRRTRNKDRPDRPVWTPRRRDNTAASDASQASIISPVQPSSESLVPNRSQIASESVFKLDKAEKLSMSRQGAKLGSVEKVMDDLQQGENVGDTSAAVTGKSRYLELSGAQMPRMGYLSNQAEQKIEVVMASGSGDIDQGNGRVLVTGENGNHRQLLRRSMAPIAKDLDGTSVMPETKPSKRSGLLGYGGQEKQVWVAIQKSGSGP